MSEKFKSIQRVKKLVKKLNPIDDIIFRKMAESREFCMIFPYYGQTATLYSAPLVLAIGAASGGMRADGGFGMGGGL